MTSYKSITNNCLTLLCLLIYLSCVNYTMFYVLPISKRSADIDEFYNTLIFVTIIYSEENDNKSFPVTKTLLNTYKCL